jgi:hypothetical protein
VKTYYRREEDGSLSLKLEGELKDCPLFEQVCVLKEIDLHYKWAPFCSSSMTLADLDKLDTVGWFVIGLPNFGLSRDGVIRAIGCDNTMEDGSVILAGQGIRDIPDGAPPPDDTYLSEDPILDKLDIPPVPTRRGGGRMTIRIFEAVIHITSPTSARTRLVANVDPNLTFLPQPLLEFVMKNLAGVLLAKLQAAAKKVARHPLTNDHARRMRQEEDFYRHWLMKKFQAVCDLKGWTMPVVAAFNLSEEELQKDEKWAEKQTNRQQGTSTNKHMERRAVSFDIPMVPNELSTTPSTSSYRRLHSAPVERPLHDDDGMSELSSKSNSSGFRILQRREERKRRQKEEEVAQARLMAAERLRPKEFSTHQQKRLDELRRMKQQRQGERSWTKDEDSVDSRAQSEPLHGSPHMATKPFLHHSDTAPMSTTYHNTKVTAGTVSEQVTDQLYRQGPFTRFFVVLLLTFVLFALLHPRLLGMLVLPDVVASWDSMNNMSWSMTLVRNTGLIFYLLLCTVAHFCLCDIALVYAFDSLELGAKAGKKLRKFYSVQVRVGVASFSLTIVGLALGRTVAKTVLRYICGGLSIFGSLVNPLIPVGVVQTLWTPFSMVGTVLGRLVHYVIYSNSVTENVGHVSQHFVTILVWMWTAIQGFYTESVAIVNGEIEATPWYEEAFALTKYLFSYSSVFLVTALVLFHASAKKSAANTIKRVFVDSDDTSTQTSDSQSKQRPATLPNIPEHSSLPESAYTSGVLGKKETTVRRRRK